MERRQRPAEIKKYNLPSNVVVKDSPVFRWLSLPYRYLDKLTMLESNMAVGRVKDFDPYTWKFIRARARENPDLEFRVGHSPILSQMARAATGKGTVLSHPVGRIFSVPISGIAAYANKWTGGDYYSPLSGTVVLRSSLPAVVGHEVGHHLDIKKRKYPTLYWLGTTVFPFQLYPEYQASRYAGTLTTPEQAQVLTPAIVSHSVSKLARVPATAALVGAHLIKKDVNFGQRKTPEKL